MRVIYVAIIWFFSLKKSFGQNTVVTIKAGEDISALYKHIYEYPVFSPGTVFFNDGTKARSKMNLNLLLEVMQFINEKGDTLALADENTIKYITVRTDTFLFQEGYLQLVSTYGKTELATRQKIKFLNEKNIGAYGISTSTHTIDNYNTLRANNTYALKVNKDLLYSKERKYYFNKAKHGFIPANKKNVLKVFSDKKGLVEKYLEERNPDYNNEGDLKSLFVYLADF